MINANILVFTGDEILGNIIAFRLRLLGMRASRVTTPEAVELTMADQMPDLIVIDLDSHGPLGQALMEQISTDTHSCKVAIMGLTREGDLAMADAAYRYGARDLLVVPFDMLVLESKVQRLLERSSTGDLKNAEAMVGA